MPSYPESLTHPSGVQLALVPEMVLVKVAGTPTASVTEVLDEVGLVSLQSGPTAGSGESVPGTDLPHAVVNDSAELHFATTSDGASVDRDVVAASSAVEWTAPVYRAQVHGHEEMLAPLADSLIVPSTVADDESAATVLEEYGLVRNDARSAMLGTFDVYEVAGERAAYDIRDELSSRLGTDVKLEFMPLVTPVAFQPNDPLFAQQWDMVQIGAGGGGTTAWDLQQGSATITVAVLDEGVDLNHPDLLGAFLNSGINLGTMSGTGAPTGNHGTPCAGIASAPINNSTGTSGVGGGTLILPIAFQNWTDVEVAAGIRYATSQGARVISMSFGWDLWDPAVIDPAITEASAAGLVMCVATHNHNTQNGVTYPATNPLVIAVGASDQSDNRKSPSSPDGEPWGSNWGPEVSVVAPGVRCPAPDRTGANGYTNDDYTMTFNGTSAATPHVAGLAALMLSRNPTLTNTDVRAILETTAARVGTLAYAVTPGHPNGTWNAEMGHGRIDASAAILATPPLVTHADNNAIALVRQLPGWSTIPVAFARGDGNWDITNGAAPTFIGSWANTPGVQVLTGDFNGNGLTDVALIRQTAGWSTIPVASARGDGNWDITNGAAPTFIGSWANTPGVQVLTGDFNGNGLTDIALVRQLPGWSTIPVAFARGDGNWDITNGAAPNFIGSWANTPGAQVVTGDFNGNDLTDIALVRQQAGWSTIPIAFARGDGNWDITNGAAPNFIGAWANTPGVRLVTGDFNGNGLTDIALVRQTPGWSTIPIAFARGDGNWDITNGAAPNFIGAWANTPGVRLVTGDFNRNGLTDIALVRQTPGWSTIPIAFARGDGNWDITNGAAPNFIGAWANTPGAKVSPGAYR